MRLWTSENAADYTKLYRPELNAKNYDKKYLKRRNMSSIVLLKGLPNGSTWKKKNIDLQKEKIM